MSVSSSAAAAGLSPVLRDPSQLSPKRPTSPPSFSEQALLAFIPSSTLCSKAADRVKPLLGDKLWQHSHRAFLFAVAIAEGQFEDWEVSREALYLACLFHDLGATEKELTATKTSFEFRSAYLAREFLFSTDEGKAQPDLVDSVVEAIWRHTDFISSQITVTGQLIQLGTLYDNIFANPTWVHPDTARSICKLFPRVEWAGCFHDTMKREQALKPWSHTSAFDFMGTGADNAWAKMLADDLGSALSGQEKATEKL
ncbi:hypothetical protein JCM8097_001457 [Rhodosporidiobolus ruineniae]